MRVPAEPNLLHRDLVRLLRDSILMQEGSAPMLPGTTHLRKEPKLPLLVMSRLLLGLGSVPQAILLLRTVLIILSPAVTQVHSDMTIQQGHTTHLLLADIMIPLPVHRKQPGWQLIRYL